MSHFISSQLSYLSILALSYLQTCVCFFPDPLFSSIPKPSLSTHPYTRVANLDNEIDIKIIVSVHTYFMVVPILVSEKYSTYGG